MPRPVLVFDIESIPDHTAIARANSLPEGDVDAAKALIGDEFPPPPYHRIVCISAICASYEDHTWQMMETATFHAGDRSEKQILEKFFELIDFTAPLLVSYSGASFDLPVIAHRAMQHRLAGRHLTRIGQYFHRYSDLSLGPVRSNGALQRPQQRKA